MNYYLDVLRNYANFSGKLDLRGYWMFIVINFIIGLLLGVVGAITGIIIIGYIYSLFILIPSIAATIRRLRDANTNVLWILITFVPIIGTIWLIILLVRPSGYCNT